MPLLKEMLNFVTDELNIYLVRHHLKPSCFFDISSPEYRDCFESLMKKRDLFLNATEHSIELKQRGREILDSPPFMLSIKYELGNSKENLERLVRAKGDEELGLALGYPEEAVRAYNKVIDGKLRDGGYNLVCLAKAKKAGIEIPSWLAYLSYVIEELDLINGKISKSSEALGKKYQLYMRKHNINLARRAEEYFTQINLPKRWVLTESGKYEIIPPKDAGCSV
jgi:hypothetical protein